MDMEELLNIFMNNGIGVACIIYFILRDYKFMSTLNETLASLKDSVTLIQTYFIEREEK